MAGSKGIVSSQFYTFSAANKTITFTNDYAGLDLGEITYITNIKNGVATVIYDPFDATKGGTLRGLTLTLAYNTTAMADTDPLQIITGFTPLNADPLLVKIVEGPDQVDDTTLLQNISDNLDYLNLALDQSEGIQMNTRDVSIKKDSQGAIVTSDVVEIPGPLLKALLDTFVVDTTGYTSVIYIIPPSTVSLNLTVDASNDNSTWFAIPFVISPAGSPSTYINSGAQTTISANTGYSIICQSFSKFIRIRVTLYTSGAVRPTAILKNIVANPTGLLVNAANIAQINGTAPLVYYTGVTGTSFGTAGGSIISGQQQGTLNPAGTATTLNTNVPHPIGVGGREWPYVGAAGGVFRYLSLDARGNIIIGGDTAFRTPNMGGFMEQSAAGTTRGIGGVFNNIQGAQSLTVADTNQVEGDTNTMLLKQILQELKILNQQLTEIPFLMNVGQSKMSDPQEYRDDNSMLF